MFVMFQCKTFCRYYLSRFLRSILFRSRLANVLSCFNIKIFCHNYICTKRFYSIQWFQKTSTNLNIPTMKVAANYAKIDRVVRVVWVQIFNKFHLFQNFFYFHNIVMEHQ